MNGAASYLHQDGLGSERAETSATGTLDASYVHWPYGEQTTTVVNLTAVPETKGFIGQRYDGDAGLQYLNARYYDPRLAIFIQPDWFEVTKPGVGTNRFAHAGDDPVNASDPGGMSRETIPVVAVPTPRTETARLTI